MDSFLNLVPTKQILKIYNICCAKFSSSSSLKGYFGEGDAEICMQICVRGPDLLIPLVIHPVSQKAHKAKVPWARLDRCVRAFLNTTEADGTGRNQTAMQWLVKMY